MTLKVGKIVHKSAKLSHLGRSVMWSTSTQHSKDTCALSDLWPLNGSAAEFMHHTEVLAYLEEYARRFELLNHIVFASEVLQISRCAEWETNARWSVELKNGEGYVVLALLSTQFTSLSKG